MMKLSGIILAAALVLAIVFPTASIAQDAGSAPASGGSTQMYDFTTEGHGEVFIENYPLGPGDYLTIRVFTLDPFEEVVKISQDGKLILPIIGETDVAGLTLPELREILKELYEEYYSDFTLSIELTGVKKIQVFVFGKAKTPGIYTVFANTTLLDFLQRIGLSVNGDTRRMIHHRGDVATEIDPFRLSILGEMEEHNMYLQFGDKIEIPLLQKSVSLTGRIFRPGIYEVLNGETLVDILILAGGPDPFADIIDAVIERARPDGTFERIHIDLAKIIDGGETFELQNRDRLYVPPREAYIYLLGAVTIPGRYLFVEGKSVEQYLAEAGGYEKDAHLSFVTIIRPGARYGNQVSEKIQVNLKGILTEKSSRKRDRIAFETPRVIIEPGDVIMVPIKGTEDKRNNLGTVLTVLNNILQSVLIFKR